MSDVTIDSFASGDQQLVRLRIAGFFDKTVFSGLLVLLALSAVPYGTVEPWWKAAFVCAVFLTCIVAIVETLLSGECTIGGARGILLPMIALSGLALIQTINIRRADADPAVATLGAWNSISADPYQTRFFVLQLLALTACLGLLYRYCRTQARINLLVQVILGIGVASAVFGIVRQGVQHEPGFVLPRIMPGVGYGQFINKNHFALLMEMTLGLGIGMGLLRGFNRDRMMIYIALLLPVWTALVLSNSRGGILSMLAQVVVAALLLMRDSRLKFGSTKRFHVMRAAMLLLLPAMITAGTIWVGGDRLVSSLSQAPSDFTEKPADLRAGVSRIEIWQASWKMFTAHPILGVGLGGYWVAITAYHDASGVSTPQEAHNDYLELLSSGGVIGLGLGAWFGVAVFRRVRDNLRSPDHFQRSLCLAALLGITGVAVHSLVDFGLHLLVNAFVFLVLIMLATRPLPVET